MHHDWGQSSTARQLVSAPLLLSRPIRRDNRHRAPIHAALPLDPVALTACAAAASSLLTAAWLRSRGVQSAAPQPAAEPEPENPRSQQQQQQPAEAGTVQQVWAAAWAAFDQQQQQEPSADTDASATSPYQDEAIATKHMLLLQGIKSSARTQLLALALGAVEQRVEQLPPPAALLLSGAQWREVATALLASASLAACAAWLGYVPAELEEAARLAIGQLDPATLAAVGLDCPGLVVGPSNSPGSSSGSSGGGGGRQRGAKGSSTRIESFYWVGLGERLALYCSVLRLLRSHSIEGQQHTGGGQQQQGLGRQQQQQQQQQWDGDAAQQGHSMQRQQPAASSASSGLAGHESPGQPASPPAAPGALASAPAGVASGSGSAVALRQAAKQTLQESSAALELRGWRATSAGVKSSSQLLALAPAVLHDMAVMVAEAVAAGYLSDVDAGLDPAAALQSAAALQTRGSTPGSSGPGSSSISSGGGINSSSIASSSSSAMAPAGALASQEDLEIMNSSGSSGASGGGREGGGGLVPLEASYWPTFLHRQLSSTRQLQRFTNQVVLQRWLSRQYHTVAAMYEDRMDLFGLGPDASLQVRRVPLRRVAELNKLRGGRFVMSLLLEFADLAAPALRALWRQVSAFVSLLLVRLIGQSLGLIYKGIRLSLSPNHQRQAQQQRRQQRRKGAGAGSKQRQEDEVPEMPGMPSWEGLF